MPLSRTPIEATVLVDPRLGTVLAPSAAGDSWHQKQPALASKQLLPRSKHNYGLSGDICMAETGPGRSACEVTPFLAPPRCYRNLEVAIWRLWPWDISPCLRYFTHPPAHCGLLNPHTTQPKCLPQLPFLAIPPTNSFYAARRRLQYYRTHRALDSGARLPQGTAPPFQPRSSLPN